ncbi:hypothetical protein B566_EDAN009234 [Ephemera danica]|nr:hypothetical protein B566_EDAN009234 [Ephemera danica]
MGRKFLLRYAATSMRIVTMGVTKLDVDARSISSAAPTINVFRWRRNATENVTASATVSMRNIAPKNWRHCFKLEGKSLANFFKCFWIIF